MTLEDIYKLKSPEILNLIKEYADEDPVNFALKFGASKTLPVKAISEQIKCRKKASQKLRALPVEKMLFETISLEQASGDLAAEYKAGLISGKRLLDITGGLGIDDIYFARRFEEIHTIEQNEVLSEIAAFNFNSLNLKNIKTYQGNCEQLIEDFPDNYFSWIYADPARRDENSRSVDLNFLKPDIMTLLPQLLQKAENVLIKLSPAFDINEALRLFLQMSRFIVVSVNDECKESLILLSREIRPDVFVAGVELHHNKPPFILEKEISSPVKTVGSAVSENKFIYEPYCGISKAGLNRFAAGEYSLNYIDSSPYYMFGNEVKNDFPGKTYETIQKLNYNLKEIKKLLKKYGIKQCHIKARGLNIKPEELTQKLKIKNGGEFYLFFYLTEEKIMAALTKRVI